MNCGTILKEEIDDIDFAGFLRGRGGLLEEGRDADGVAERVEFTCLEGDGGPFAKGVAGFIGVGEYDHFVVDQRGEHLSREHLETATSEPKGLRQSFGTDDGGFLGFDNTDSGTGGFTAEQMLTEETSMKGVTSRELALQEGVNPGGIARLDAVTVGLIIHNLASTDALLFVDLPENDTTITGDAEVVLLGGVVQLVVAEVGTG